MIIFQRQATLVLAITMVASASLAVARDLHYSSWSDRPEIYMDVLSPAKVAPCESDGRIRAGIVPHHFLAAPLIADFFELLKRGSSPRTVVLIGPNHFRQGVQRISLSSLPWKTPFGLMPADRDVVAGLAGALSLPEDPDAFGGEHSVGVLIPFIKYHFPQSRLVAVLIAPDTPPSLARRLADQLLLFLQDPDTVVILSMDFSHDSSSTVAGERDATAKQVIAALDTKRVQELHTDCRKGLYSLTLALKQFGQARVRFHSHSDSAVITRDYSRKDVTSYFTISFDVR